MMEIRKFIRRAFLFLLPIALISLPCVIILKCSGEYYGESDFQPLERNQLVGLAYTEINGVYKLNMTDRFFRPDIVALGSSRILQVKENVIKDGYSFYNAGGAIYNIYQYKLFADKLHYSPQLFIINIDQWLFNPNCADQKATFDLKSYEFPRWQFIAQCQNLVTDIFMGKIDFAKLLDKKNHHIGINARINHNGFSHDGSYCYGQITANPSSSGDYNFKDTYSRIDEGNRNFQYGNRADTSIIEAMDSFLIDCSRRHIAVLAILPPFAPRVFQKMEISGKYHYLSQIYPILSACFAKYPHCYLYDFTDMTSMQVQDSDFLDGFHGSELIYNIIIQDIIKNNRELQRFFVSFSDIDSINNQYRLRHIHYHRF